MRFGEIATDILTLDDTQVDRENVFCYLLKKKKKDFGTYIDPSATQER